MNITKDQIKDWLKQNNYITSDDLILDMIHDCIQDLAPKWISVEDDLPVLDRKVLAVTTEGSLAITAARAGVALNTCGQPITHWMYLPEPPNETLGQ